MHGIESWTLGFLYMSMGNSHSPTNSFINEWKTAPSGQLCILSPKSYYENRSKSNITYFGVSEIGNTARLHQREYVAEGYSSLYTKFHVIFLSFVSLILILVCWKVVIDRPNVKYRLFQVFEQRTSRCSWNSSKIMCHACGRQSHGNTWCVQMSRNVSCPIECAQCWMFYYWLHLMVCHLKHHRAYLFSHF